MKKTEVRIGSTYLAKVTNALCPVRITGINPFGGWNGLNMTTNYRVRIHRAGKLRYEVQPCNNCGRYIPIESHTCDRCKAKAVKS